MSIFEREGEKIEELKKRFENNMIREGSDGCYGTDGSHEALYHTFRDAYGVMEDIAEKAILLLDKVHSL